MVWALRVPANMLWQYRTCHYILVIFNQRPDSFALLFEASTGTRPETSTAGMHISQRK